ncbi:MAG: hypothetical protein M1832_003530 [Thelocarpon impressellum]|nr:MAG: hypothetical protein M1832_003530 [Thelocarpon impressellum]
MTPFESYCRNHCFCENRTANAAEAQPDPGVQQGAVLPGDDGNDPGHAGGQAENITVPAGQSPVNGKPANPVNPPPSPSNRPLAETEAPIPVRPPLSSKS